VRSSLPLLCTSIPFWLFCVLAFFLTVVPAFVITSVTLIITTAFDLRSPNEHSTSPGLTASDFFGMVLFAPIVETLILSFMLRWLLKRGLNELPAAMTCALIWGLLHATLSPFRFLPSAWGFFIFACSYLAWRGQSYKKAFAAAAIPHSLANLCVFVLSLALKAAA
jgi:hypothetical protein